MDKRRDRIATAITALHYMQSHGKNVTIAAKQLHNIHTVLDSQKKYVF